MGGDGIRRAGGKYTEEAKVGKVVLDMAVSLDGYICGPNGEDGGLHDWYFAADAATAVTDELLASIGAIVLGSRAFGTAPDGFDTPYNSIHRTKCRISS